MTKDDRQECPQCPIAFVTLRFPCCPFCGTRLIDEMRVLHVSGREGTLMSRGPKYCAVTFDGDEHAARVRAETIIRLT